MSREPRHVRSFSTDGFETLAECTAVAVFVLRDRQLIYTNPAASVLTGYSPEALSDCNPQEIIHAEDWPAVARALDGGAPPPGEAPLTVRISALNGETVWSALTLAAARIDGAEVTILTATDTTSHARAERELRGHREWLELAQRAGRSLAWEWRPEDDRMVVVGSAEEVFGVPAEAMPRTGDALLHHIPEEDQEFLREAIRTSSRTGTPFAVEHRVNVGPGDVRWLAVRAQAFRGRDGRVERVIGVSADVTRRKRIEKERTFLATHDPLTGVINRGELERRIQTAIRSARREGRAHALCYIDLDDFKLINDTCGHVAGDHLLRSLTSALTTVLPRGDTLGRLGGDEFGALLMNCSVEDAARRARHLLMAIKDFQFMWRDQVYAVGASIGIVSIRETPGTLSDVLRAADAACYVAKSRGRNRVHVYRPDDAEITERQSLSRWAETLSLALTERRFRLFAQPIRPLTADAGPPLLEALLRLVTNDGRLVVAEEFVPAAERYHLVSRLDRWAVRHALQAATSSAMTSGASETVLTINLSGQSLSEAAFMDEVVRNLDATGVPAHRIGFEITETAAIADLQSAAKFMGRLRELGCRFYLDDFGSGLSSFGYLQELPVDGVKIDGELIRSALDNPVRREMVSAIHRIARAMNLTTIGESVESEAALTLLRAIGVHYAQGNWVGEPRPLEQWLGA